MTTDAILAMETLGEMSASQPNPAKQASDQVPCRESILANDPQNNRPKGFENDPLDAHANDPRWTAVTKRSATHDGEFVFAVSTTGVYCRPSCPARRPRRENVSFYLRPEHAEKAGYRACLRCKPKSVSINPQSDGVKAICRY